MGDRPLPPIALVGGYPPGSLFGGAIILRNLLIDSPASDITIFANKSVIDHVALVGGGLLKVPHIGIRPIHARVRGLRRLARALNIVLVPVIAWKVSRYSRGTIVAFPWGGQLGSELLVGAWLASILTRRRLVVYEMDEWKATLGHAGLTSIWLERTFHRRILKSASAILAVSSALGFELIRLGAASVQVLPAATDWDFAGGDKETLREPVLLFGGSVYGAQADSIRRAALAAKLVDLRLVLCTDSSADELANAGIPADVEVRPSMPIDRFRSEMTKAVALLLPLSFDHVQELIVRTSFPTKTAEYVASGTPILVHAPPYAAVTAEALRGRWAIVVSDPDVRAVAEALQSIVNDQHLRTSLRMAAKQTLEAEFALASVRRKFVEAVSS